MKQHCPSCGKKFDYEQHLSILRTSHSGQYRADGSPAENDITAAPCEKAITQAEKIVGTFHGWIAADGEQFRISDWKKSDLPAAEADF